MGCVCSSCAVRFPSAGVEAGGLIAIRSAKSFLPTPYVCLPRSSKLPLGCKFWEIKKSQRLTSSWFNLIVGFDVFHSQEINSILPVFHDPASQGFLSSSQPKTLSCSCCNFFSHVLLFPTRWIVLRTRSMCRTSSLDSRLRQTSTWITSVGFSSSFYIKDANFLY